MIKDNNLKIGGKLNILVYILTKNDNYPRPKRGRAFVPNIGERMSLIYEYGDRREQKGWNAGIKEIVQSFIDSGISLEEISQKTGKPIKELKKILND